MPSASIQSYLWFGGRCEEALDFYRRAAGAKVELMMHFNESPEPMPGMIQAGFETKVMHCEFRIGDTVVMASDGMNDQSHFSGFSLALSVPTEADCDRIFNALADGGQVQMPLGKTFWSPRYGMLTDRFGMGWMVMMPGEPPQRM